MPDLEFTGLIDAINAITPADSAFAITPGASALSHVVRGIYVGTAGHVEVTTAGANATILFKNVPAGTILPIRATHVTGNTTATDLVGLY